MNLDLLEELRDLCSEFRTRTDVSSIVLAGAGKCFSAGADIKDERMFADNYTLQTRRRSFIGPDVLRNWEDLPQITIAAIEGYAIGGGLSLALCCDFRVAGENAFFSVPEVRLGFNFGLNTVPRLVSLIGPAKSKRLILLDERVSADTAASWGLIDELCDDGQAVSVATDLARKAADNPALPMEMTKRAINAQVNTLTLAASHADMDQGHLNILARRAATDADD
jgi:enoyl-CoA hydratase/carnithine racemase